VTLSLLNSGDPGGYGSTGDWDGSHPMVVTGTLPSGLTLGTVPTGTPWNCNAVTTTTVSCKSDSVVAAGSSYPLLTLPVNVAANAPASATVSGFTFSGAGMTAGNFASDTITIDPPPSLAIAKSHTGTFTQGSTAVWNIQVSNNSATAAGATDGSTVTVSDTLPSGYSLSSYSGTGWSCAGTTTVSCTSSQVVAGAGGNFNLLALTVNIPANSPVSVTNNAKVYGGGDLVHTNSANAATGSDTVTVVQGPAQMAANAGTTPQSAAVNTAFTNAPSVTVRDAASNPVSGVNVTFTAPGSGASGKFSNNTTTIAVATNASGVAAAPFTANGTAGGPYTVTAAASGVTTVNFSLTNTSTAATVTNLTSTTANGSYSVSAMIPISITFSKLVNVTGLPQLALNSGGTATYSSGTGTTTLTFNYTVAAGQNSSKLDATSTTALSLNGGTISDTASQAAILTLPAPGAAGSLGANKSIVIDTVAPTVVSFSVLRGAESYNLIGSTRNRLPWQISGIQVVFSKPIASGSVSSLTGLTATALSGLGTNTLTWSFNPVALGSFTTGLAGSGASALRDAASNPLAGGTGFSQTVKILWGDFNDDGVVNASDFVDINKAISQPYNLFADMNGDGVINLSDVVIARGRNGTSLP